MSSSAQQALLINDKSSERCMNGKKSKCSKCIDYCLIPLNILVLPLTSCMRSSCWSKRRYFQYDLALQLMGIYQTLIGALWASSFVSIIEHFDNSDQIETVYIALYVAGVYAACNIIVVLMQRKQFFSGTISFFVGTLGHIVAFGVKALAFQIMNVHFSSTFVASITYFWICLAISIIMIYGLSFVRKQFCFAMKELHEQTAEMRQKIADEVSNATHVMVNEISNKVSKSLERIKSNKNVHDNNVDIYESDFIDLLLNDEEDNNIHQESEHNEEEEEEESFNDLIKEIDTDAFTIAMGGIFTELIIYAVTGTYVQLDEDEGSQDDKGESDLKSKTTEVITGVFVVCIAVLMTFGIFNKIIAFIQMKRDRVLYTIFQKLEIRSKSSSQIIQMKMGDMTIDENCCIAGCIRFSYKSYKLSEHIVTFIIGFTGWAFGWALVSGLYATEDVMERFYYSLVLTGFGILLYFGRSTALKRKYENWKREAMQTYIRKTIETQNAEEGSEINNYYNNDDDNDDNDNVFMNDEEERKYIELETDEYDFFEMKAKHHQKLYSISNLNFFFRKSYGLMVALPWELSWELVMEKRMKNVTHQVLARFVIAMVATVILSHSGIQFVKIQSEAHHHSTAHALAQLLKGNYMKLKKFL